MNVQLLPFTCNVSGGRYLMESASARIVGFTPGSPEWLSFYGDLPNNLSSSVSYIPGIGLLAWQSLG